MQDCAAVGPVGAVVAADERGGTKPVTASPPPTRRKSRRPQSHAGRPACGMSTPPTGPYCAEILLSPAILLRRPSARQDVVRRTAGVSRLVLNQSGIGCGTSRLTPAV